MNVQVLARALAVVVALGVPALGSAQPEAAGPPPDQAVQPGEPPPHLIRLEGSGAQVVRDGTALALEPGDPVLFGDRVDIGAAYGQVLWSEGSRVALDHGGRLEALAPDLLALTAGRAFVQRPASATAVLRVDTPAGSFLLAAGGEYRLTIDGEETTLGVTRGQAEVQTGMGAQTVAAGQQIAVRDGLTPEAPRRFNAAGYDSFIAWASAPAGAPAAGAPLDTFQDPRFEAYSDVFNREGAWETDPQLGAVWFPTVGADWRPYADGYWQAYGPQSQWLWVGRDAWSWPTHHFGRWGVNGRGRWYWTPGREWAPAWVSWSVGPGYIGWTPLGSQNRPVSSWDSVAQRRGVYPGGTLDPSRAWTVIPSDRFGERDRMRLHAVDPRTLDNLSAFVSQRTGPPGRYGPGRGGAGAYGYGAGGTRPYGAGGGTAVYGPGGYYGGVRSRTGDDTTGELRRGVGPTRVGPPAPGYGGPTPPPEDPYERAQRAVAPRSPQRAPRPTTSGSGAGTSSETAPARGASPQRRPPREAPQTAPPPAAPEPRPTPPPAAEPAPPARDRTSPPDAATGRSTGTSTGRKAVPRP